MQMYSLNCCPAPFRTVAAPPAPGVVTRSIYHGGHLKAAKLHSKRLNTACPAWRADTESTSSPNNSNARAQATAAALAAATLLILPVGGSCAAADLSAVSGRYSLAVPSQATYSSIAQSAQLSPIAAPEVTSLLVPATPFQDPGKVTPPAAVAAGPRQSTPGVQNSNSSCDPSVSSQPQQQQKQQPLAAGALDPPTPPNSPLTPPPPHAPLPTPQQPHFPLLPSPPPPALPPQLLPPCNDPPPQKLLPRAQPGGLQQNDVLPVCQDAALRVSSSSSSSSGKDSSFSTNHSTSRAFPEDEDSPISLLRLFKAEQLLQEQWQQALLFSAFTKGSAAITAVQESPALAASAGLPVTFQNTESTPGSWEEVYMGSGVLWNPPPHAAWGLDAGGGGRSAVMVSSYSAHEPGLFAAATYADNSAAAPVAANGSAANVAPGQSSTKLSSSSPWRQLPGPALASDFPMQQVLDAVPTPALFPEAASAETANHKTRPSNGSKREVERLAATGMTATAVDSGSGSITGQGSTGTPVLPLQGGGSGSTSAADAGSSSKVIRASPGRQQSPMETRQSAKAADSIKEGIKGAKEQIAARSKQLEYQSPGYEQLLDASKRLLVALIAIAQFALKVALAVGVVLVKGLVQLIQWFITLGK